MARKPSTKSDERSKRDTKKKQKEESSSEEDSASSSEEESTPMRTRTDSKTKPTYQRMVFEAIKDLGNRTFHSAVAISKYIDANYPVPEASFKRSVRLAIYKALDDGLLIARKASYRLSAKGQDFLKPRKIIPSTRKISTRSKSKKRKSSSSIGKEEPKKRTTRNSSKTSDDEEEPKKSRSSKRESSSSSAKSTPLKSKSTPVKPKKRSVSEPSSVASTPSKIPRPPGLKFDCIWQYDDHGWKNYESAASDTVEEVYLAYLAHRGDTDVRAVKSGNWEYMVDFMAMKQTNIQHENHTIRNIRRVSLV